MPQGPTKWMFPLYGLWTQGLTSYMTILSILGVSLLTVTFSHALCGHLPLFCLEIMATFPALCQP